MTVLVLPLIFVFTALTVLTTWPAGFCAFPHLLVAAM